MAKENCKILDTGDGFPVMEFNSVIGEIILLPRDFKEKWNILLFYRGHW